MADALSSERSRDSAPSLRQALQREVTGRTSYLVTTNVPSSRGPIGGAAPHPARADWSRRPSSRRARTTRSPGASVTVKDRYDRYTMLRTGAVWQRLHLRGTERRLAMQPLNQIVELADRERELGRRSEAELHMEQLALADGHQIAFGFRCGYSDAPATASARRPGADTIDARDSPQVR